jgi:OPA family glycerol-3-phosphate transporter-like MFS transporter
MSRRAVSGRTLAFVLVLELAVGAFIWFRNTPSATAQTAGVGSAMAAGSAAGSASSGSTAAGTVGSMPMTGSNDAVPPGAQAGSATTPTADAGPPTCKVKISPPSAKKTFLDVLKGDLLPIGILVLVIVVMVARLPRVELGHTKAFRSRRLLNWLPLGLTYSFLYFGRYNIKQFQGIGLTEAEYGAVFGVGSMVYGLAFLLNGPLTDRWGGRATILISAAGSGVANLVMGYMAATGNTFGMSVPTAFTVAYATNMYFQSFGAVSIVKVNAAWFHTRERGTFGGIFGILISLGLYFAYDLGARIKQAFAPQWIFLIPAMLLFLFFVLSWLWVRNEPGDTGHPNFDLGDATNDNDKASVKEVFIKLFTHPVILTISFIELCSGFLRQAILQWGVDFGKGVGIGNSFVFQNWGMVSCIAGITGGMFAGSISDHLFQSRRSPVSGVLYGIMLAGAIMIVPLFAAPGAIGWIVAFMSMAIIGVHGMLTATASADFAGKKNTGMAVGIIDGFVYVGSTVQSFIYGAYLPPSKIYSDKACELAPWDVVITPQIPNPAAKQIDNWHIWPYAMIPIALIGFLLTLRIWNAKPKVGGGGGH